MAVPPQYFDLITTGRTGVDLYPLETGVPLARVETFGKFPGGSAANVAGATARTGRSAAVVTRTGEDPFDAFPHGAPKDFGVDDRRVAPVPARPTPLTCCGIFPQHDFPPYSSRRPKAPDLEIRADEPDPTAVRAAGTSWTTGTGPSEEPGRSAALAAPEAHGRRTTTVLAPDRRPVFRRDPGQARPYHREALRHAAVAVGDLDACEAATGGRGPGARAEAPPAAGAEPAVAAQGSKGVLAVHRDGTRAEAPPAPVEVVHGLGAGDAFGGSPRHGPLSGRDLEPAMRHADAAGAVVASRPACSSATPTEPEVADLLARASSPDAAGLPSQS
ncbi:PfkB family carbohydrate kinase [Streptomyces sp. XY152]|uniref:PfkB family carbohydrate kinase n=1 Tax=Streptomyces sp. XY152 TaxID=1415560 RepID=UPI0006B04359|nr:PfkB family carbohydrate kinase [Streptomyces sp. XY152]KOV25494.1 5-dehydro-2-deoxygluconokinase [Streptomyces sp. XY152]